ncbi:hypothetical protein KC19_8G172000 [Ceratodon purpureus]|uniref:Uncharacterized protein n=1 Tax=Ceratodon purpureus TaxID=3225 RepID=A0A8T0H479_CERPU|nr:hypothetical protein KC19_N023000 [Ceratodon purpureus]KAG0565194.1 hypothetical protein KC19_8G172000 [Ceratodon purpureus]
MSQADELSVVSVMRPLFYCCCWTSDHLHVWPTSVWTRARNRRDSALPATWRPACCPRVAPRPGSFPIRNFITSQSSIPTSNASVDRTLDELDCSVPVESFFLDR